MWGKWQPIRNSNESRLHGVLRALLTSGNQHRGGGAIGAAHVPSRVRAAVAVPFVLLFLDLSKGEGIAGIERIGTAEAGAALKGATGCSSSSPIPAPSSLARA